MQDNEEVKNDEMDKNNSKITDSNDENKKNDDKNKGNNSIVKSILIVLIVILALILAIVVIASFIKKSDENEENRVSYTDLIKQIDNGEIKKVEMTVGSTKVKLYYKDASENGIENYIEEASAGDDNSIDSDKKEETKKYSIVPNTQAFIELIQKKVEDGNDIELVQKEKNSFISFGSSLISFIPTLIMCALIIMLIQMQGLGDKGKVYDPDVSKDKITFKDVAGLKEEKSEMIEIVDFLKEPKKYTSMGAKVPKGVLLCGKPGTGKTLIAKAIAGEANVPFISMSGSEFVEMFAGLGASRVRKLFDKAEKISPCIIFIDEIDAIGSRRESSNGADTENNQTLNQLLVKMDGFDTDTSIIVIAATNRPEMLDEALLRPGRFDRIINIGMPDITDREEILKIHAKNKKLDDDVDLKSIAEDTAGFSGAELANILNEAAIYAANRNHEKIKNEDIDDALKKVTVGLEKKDRVVSEKDKQLTAYHEAGHAVVSKYLKTQDTVKEISIIPRGVAGGYTLYKTNEDKWYISKTEMEERLVSLLGGRAAEKLALNDISTGASNDIEVAMKIARDMVIKYGMSDEIGPMSINLDDKPYEQLQLLGNDLEDKIGKVVRELLDDAYLKAQKILISHRDKLDIVASLLIEKEKISADEFNEIFNDDKA